MALRMGPRELFETNLAVIERAIVRVCLDANLHGPDAEDFASSVRLALLVDDCAVLRKFEGRSSFATFITIVIRRMLVDRQRAAGRWQASVEALRRGDAAVALERLIRRDRRPFDEAAAIVQALHPELTKPELEEIAVALPERMPLPRVVAIAADDEERLAGADAADDRVNALDRAHRAGLASRTVRETMQSMTAEDRMLLRLRYGKNATVADIARILGVEQRPLYRRIEALRDRLRAALERAGIDRAAASDLVGGSEEELQFGFEERENEIAQPSISEGRRSGEQS